MSSRITDRNAAFLDEMGIGPAWVLRNAPSVPVMPAESPVVAEAQLSAGMHESGEAVSRIGIADMDWRQLKETVSTCPRCDLCRTRKKTVFGTGDEKANWLFVGEGPGRNEDIQGEPFVGPAGKLLDNMLAAMGLQRGANAYIANIVKCRPTGADGRDRPPSPEEVAACMPYLERQIALIRPAVIVALGKTAALSLLNLDPDTAVSSLRGKVHRYRDLPLIVTYHPAYLLRNLPDKRKAWIDLCLAMKTYAG